MKILCLHGYGTNPDVLRYQLSGIMRAADRHWEFYFLSGEVECQAAGPEIESAFPGPYYCWTRSFDVNSVDSAHGLIEDAIEEHGPFAAILGFSQGAAISASFILEYAATRPNEALPFRMAIFFSPTIPCAADLEYAQSLLSSLSSEDIALLQSGEDSHIARLPPSVRSAFEEFVKVAKATHAITRELPAFYLDRPIREIPSPLHPELLEARMKIPTLHLRGKGDIPGLYDCGQLVESFCHPRGRTFIQHSGGHDIPRTGPDVQKIVYAIEGMLARSELPGQ